MSKFTLMTICGILTLASLAGTRSASSLPAYLENINNITKQHFDVEMAIRIWISRSEKSALFGMHRYLGGMNDKY